MKLVALQTEDGHDVWICPDNVFLIEPVSRWISNDPDNYDVIGSFVVFTDSTGKHSTRIRVAMTPGEVVARLAAHHVKGR